MTQGRRVALPVCVGVLALAPHLVLWRASHMLTRTRRNGDDLLVLVPGHRLRPDGRLTLVGAWRCTIAARTARDDTARFLVSGGLARSGRTEAQALAERLQRRHGIDPDRVEQEHRARTTMENVTENRQRLAGARAIAVASQPFHALRVRRAVVEQLPELADRLVPARDAALLESLLFGWWQLAHEARRRRRTRHR